MHAVSCQAQLIIRVVETTTVCIQSCVPDLEYDKKEAIICLDLPSVHELSASIRQKAINLGIHLFGFPHNTTHWSQMFDSRYCFGIFKRKYYDLVERYIIDRDNAGVENPGKISADVIPMLVRQAWAAVTENCIVRAYIATGVLPGHSTTMKERRRIAQAVVIASAHDAKACVVKPAEVGWGRWSVTM